MFDRDWHAWHADYDRPESVLSRRLAAVQEQIRDALDELPPGPLRALSLCAGQGRDLIGALAEHQRAPEVRCRLVELDPRNAATARDLATAAGLDIEVVVGDASRTDHYAELAPADLVLVCGVFGNLTEPDVARTIGHCAQLCRTGGSVVWTRHRSEPDVIPGICDWFDAAGFELRWLSDPSTGYGVGRHLHLKDPEPLPLGTSMFTFVGHERLNGGNRPWWA